MTDAEGQRSGSLRKTFVVLAILALVTVVAYLQVNEHQTPRPAFADQHTPGQIITSGGETVGGLFAN